MPDPVMSQTPGDGRSNEEIARSLNDYWIEADNNRRSGLNPRDDRYRENLNLYWNRFDFSQKADWQAKEVMPEVPTFLDRFAAAMKEALLASPEGFYTVIDPADEDRNLAVAVKRMTDMWLSRSGRNMSGNVLSFSTVFEEQVKMGALMAMSSVTLWKDDVKGGRVSIETVDPRNVWLDHTFRNLYRIRRIELDKHDLKKMVKEKDGRGKPIWNLQEVERLITDLTPDRTKQEKAELQGTGQEIVSNREPIVIDEYIATILDSQGDVITEDGLAVVANGQYLIRGPEKNPFMHGQDWLVYAPLISTPLSPYGRTYMEDMAAVAKTFNELTNMILDAVHVTGLNAYALVPGMLLDPGQAATGISPNKVFLLEDSAFAKDFAEKLDLGTLDAGAVQVWQAMKNELREGFGINEIGLGQFAPKGRTSATEILETQQSSSALVRSIAQSIESRWLEPTLDLVWKTGLQHVSVNDDRIAQAAGIPMFDALITRRKELIQHPFTFQARGISTMIQKAKILKSLLFIISVVASNEQLLAEFMARVDMGRFVEVLFELSDVDIKRIQLSERDRLIRSVTEPLNAAAERTQGSQGATSPAGRAQVQSVISGLGVGRGQ